MVMRLDDERTMTLATRALGLIVVVSVALALAALIWRLNGWNDGREQIVTAEVAPASASGPDVQIQAIVALAPFGGAVGGGDLPATSLGVVLRGIMLAYPAEASLALIATGDGVAATYGVGASPIGNAVIEAIEINRVILKVGERREALSFPQTQAGTSAVASPTPGAGITITTPGVPPAVVVAPTPGVSAGSPTASAGAAGSPGSSVGGTTGATGGTSSATPSAAALGVNVTGEGYRIGANPSPELTRFGLRPGDVIETLNGQSVGNITADRQLFEQAAKAGTARVEVVRDGRRVTLTLPLRPE